MSYHNIRIRLRGCNEFTEKFPGGSVEDAKRLAKTRYPDAQYISWVGSTQSDEQEAKNRQWAIEYKKKVDENNERVFGQSGQQPQSVSYSSSSSNVEYDNDTDGNGLGFTLVAGFFGLVIIIVILPLIAAGWTGKFAFGKARERGMKMPLTLLLTLLASSGSLFGTVAIYDKLGQESEQLPSQSYVEFIQGVIGN